MDDAIGIGLWWLSKVKIELSILHGDIIPEHSCDGELIERNQTPAYVHIAWCSSCGTEFTYAPDSDWVTVVLPGMRNDLSPSS